MGREGRGGKGGEDREGKGEDPPICYCTPKFQFLEICLPYPPSYRIYDGMILTKMWVRICLYCSNCTEFVQLILTKIIEIVATRFKILRLKCTKFDFGWGSAPDPAGELTALPRPLAGSVGPTSKGRGGEGRGAEGRDLWMGRGISLPKVNFLVTSLEMIDS